MNLLFVIPEYPPDFGGGIATFYGALLPALARRGVSVTALVGSALSSGPRPREEHGVRILPLDHARVARLSGRFGSLALAPDLCRHLAAAWAAWEQTDGGAAFDRVECADWGLSFVPWLLRADAPPTRVRLHASIGQIARHEPQPGLALAEALTQLLEARLLPRAAELVTYGAGNQAWWRDALALDIALRPPAFLPPSAPSAPPSFSGRGLVAGRVQAWKGPATLCRALRSLGPDAPPIDWFGRSTLSSDGRDTSSALASDFPEIWGRLVHPSPPIPPVELHARQAAARFVVVPSDWDVFNFTAAEALASGAVLICSEGAGAADLIRPGENGFRFPAGDHAALAARLREVLALSPADRARIGAAALASIATELAPDRIAALEHAALETLAPPARPLPRDPALDALFTPADSILPDPSSALAAAGLARLPLPALVRHVAGRARDRVLRRR